MEEVLARVFSHYALPRPETAQQVAGGLVDENWVIDTDLGRYFLKRHHPFRSQPDLIRAQHSLVERLRKAGFPAPNILFTIAGDTLLILEGRVYEVQDYIDGEAYDPGRSAHLESAAQTLARFHLLVKDFAPPVLFARKALYGPATLDLFLGRLCDSWQLERDPDLARIARRLKIEADRLAVRFARHERLLHRVIHGDYWAGNLLFQGESVVGVVDYDKANWQPRLAEIAEALIYFTSVRHGSLQHVVYPGFLQWEALNCFLQAYTTVAEVSEAEILALPDYICAVWFSVSVKRLWQGMRTRYSPGLEERVLAEPPGRPPDALAALQEVLALIEWVTNHDQRMVEITRSVVLG